MQGRQGGGEGQRVGGASVIAWFEFRGPYEGNVPKSGRREQNSRLRESNPGHRLNPTVPRDDRKASSAH